MIHFELGQRLRAALAIGILALGAMPAFEPSASAYRPEGSGSVWAQSGAPANLTAALNRLVELVGASGGALLALVWARVALSWFSNDVTKKIQAKDRARDALIGTLLFTAALTGLAWGLAHWVLTGT